MTTEFSRFERLDAIGGEERTVTMVADAGERAALAERFGLLSVEKLEGEFAIRRDGAGVAARGRVRAAVVQACVATGDPIDATVDETVALLFVESSVHDEEVELDPNALDTLEIENGGIDLGEAAAETMVLALDPFPRSDRAEVALKKAGVLSESEAGPFGALAGLKAKLAEKE